MNAAIKNYTIMCIAILLMGSSCVSTKRSTYFYDATQTQFKVPDEVKEIPIQKSDILYINISSLNAEASAIFNATNNINASTTSSTGTSSNIGGYLVNNEGYIQLPVLGYVKAAGLTKKELKSNITNQILEKKLLLDPIVTIRQMNYEVTVLGEVGRPTVITVPSEKISIVKALGLAGDITIYGRKDNVLLIREHDGERKVARIDLNSPSFFTSPYYYLEPNDVIYVEANKNKVASVNRAQLLLPAILSGLSVVAIVLDRIIK
ncbi:MAG: polysaccharide biosynthesis/export family protein [Bacteroidota bacterium]|nr:polysaccharide biosynthesis/export family protein [Bacteroidota bacterium]